MNICLTFTLHVLACPRFILTRFWFTISLGAEKSKNWLHSVVVDVQEVTPGDVWNVAFRQANDDGTHSNEISLVYVLEPTCEVIGQPPRPSSSSQAQACAPSVTLRADWSAYVHTQARATGDIRSSLCSQLKWAHFAEYDRGISRLWLTRIAKEGDDGIEKRRVAERYVLASVVANRYLYIRV